MDAPTKKAAPAAPAAKPASTPAPAAPKAAAPAAAKPAAAAPAKAAFGAGVPAEPAAAKPAAAAPADAPAANEPKPAAKPAPKLGDVPKLGDEPVEGDIVPVPALGDAPTDEAPASEEGDAPAGDAGEAAADEPAAEGEEPAEEKPIEYEFAAPEGEQPYRPELIDAYKEVLSKHAVAPEVAQDILNTMLPAIRADVDQQLQAAIEAKSTEWSNALKERHGKNLPGVMNLANRALAKSGASPEFVAFIRESALAWNPDFIDMLAWVGQRVTNDRSAKAVEPPLQPPLDPVAAAAADYDRRSAGKRG